MGRIISIVCAIGLILVGMGMAYIQPGEPHRIAIPGRMIIGAFFVIGIGLIWLLDIFWWRGQ